VGRQRAEGISGNGNEVSTQGVTEPASTIEATTSQSSTTSTASTTTAPAPPPSGPTTATVTESEFKIALASSDLKAGKITFDVKNEGKLPHDLAIKETNDKSKLIAAGGSARLSVTLKPGRYELFCSVPGHEAAGMKLEVDVS
jgi:uncharacterized cupredoxin-like copper-binding protein